jgi:hypothetical protein
MAPKTQARSNLARSNASRSGWPVLQGFKVKLYALSNVARSGATRSNYTSSNTFISIGGIDLGEGAVIGGPGILSQSVTVNDALNDVPTTAQLTFYKFVPVEGTDVVITLGSKNNLRREFGGTIVSSKHRYVGDRPLAPNMVYDAQLIDYSWGLNRKKVSGKFTTASVATIAAAIMGGAPGYTLNVAPDIAATIIDEITFTEQTPADAFHQLAKRVGGDWFCDYSKVIQLFFDYTADSAPTILNRAHTTLRDLAWSRDLSQVVTRVYGDIGGSEALEAIGVGASLIPVSTGVWYEPAGGVVLIGQQRVNYSGVNLGGGGSLVGPGAAPTGAPNVALLPGAGVDVGSHDYAVTFKTASGESIVGPRVTMPVGIFLPPPTAPTAGAAGAGTTGPDPGVHDYAVSFVISTGETVPGPRLSVSTDLTPPPTTGPTADVGAVGPGPDRGQHDYAVTFITPTGETPAGPIGSQFTQSTAPISPPPSTPTALAPTANGSVTPGTHYYTVSFVTASGETTPTGVTQGSTGTSSSTAVPNPASSPYVIPSPADRRLTANFSPNTYVNYSYVYRTPSGTTTAGPSVQIQTVWCGIVGNNSIVQPTIQPYNSTDGRVTSIDIYRLYIDTGNNYLWYKVATIANDTAGSSLCAPVWDDFSQAAGSAPPPTNTTAVATPLRTIPLRNIPIGPNGVTARKLYRTFANSQSAYYLLTTIPNNSTTSFDDTLGDATAAQPPTSNTAYINTAAHLSTIPTGSAPVTGRKLYRRSGGAGLRYVATIANNSSTTYDDTMANASLGAAPPTVNTAVLRQIPLSAIPLGNSLVQSRKLYRTVANASGGTLQLLVALADNVTTTFLDTVNDAALGAAALTVSTAQAAQVQLSAIPLGAAAVTARVIYRTKAGASQLQLVVTLADNTTTTYLDVKADVTLGANAPTSDTSLLQQPSGNVLSGSTALPCATVAAFLAAGGWCLAASQILRYTGITGNSLTGIPTSGPGSIGATITFNSTVVAAPMLTGVPTNGPGTIRYPIVKGDPVDVFIQEDDLPAQAAVRLQLPGSDGIIEDEIQDRRLSATEGRARARARLNLLAALDTDGKVGIVTVTYTCRDINTRAGRTISINIGPPINLLGDFLIQRVTASKFYVPNLPPTYQVEASSVRFSYEELLRFIQAAGE